MKTFKFSILILLLWFVVHSVIISIDGLFNKEHTTDAALVLGNKVNEDGTLSNRLQERLNKGNELYQKALVKKIIVSGGLGKEGFYEAEKMKEYLLSKHIPDSCIIVDNRGDNTLRSVNNAVRIQRIMHYNSITVVSQFYHLSRTKLLFHKGGFKNVYGASPIYFEVRDVYSVTREFFAYYYALVFVKKNDLTEV